jgi:putative PIN family toxin of toxin-antitoxin system
LRIFDSGRRHRKIIHPILIHSTPPRPLLVLDTNVVLDWIAFDDARVRPIAAAIERKALLVVSNEACVLELRRALGYAQVKLDDHAQTLAFERYIAQAKIFEPSDVAPARELPQCEDPDDQKFLDLAWHARASHLVTRDKALLKLARPLSGRFAVLAPDAFLAWMRAQDRG